MLAHFNEVNKEFNDDFDFFKMIEIVEEKKNFYESNEISDYLSNKKKYEESKNINNTSLNNNKSASTNDKSFFAVNNNKTKDEKIKEKEKLNEKEKIFIINKNEKYVCVKEIISTFLNKKKFSLKNIELYESLKNIVNKGEDVLRIKEKLKKGNLLGRKRTHYKNKEKTNNNDKIKLKKGRKKKDSEEIKIHTRFKPDNIIYKIKANFLDSLLDFINIFLSSEEKLAKVDPTYPNKTIKKDYNEKLMNTKIYEIFNVDISSKYSTKDCKNYNREIIKKILDSNENKYFDILKIFNLTYLEWFDIFRNKINENIKEKIGDSILEKFDKRIEFFIEKIYEQEINKNNKNEIKEKAGGDNKIIMDYLCSILLICYNYEKWFSMKIPRSKLGE